MEDDDITEDISMMDSDWCIHLYNSGYSEYGLNVKFDELVTLRDALSEIIEGRKLQAESVSVKGGYNFDDVSVSNVDVSKMKNLLK